jgi:hypothetical protein
LHESKKLMEFIKLIKLSEKEEIEAILNGNIGNAYLGMLKYDLALKAHFKELEISLRL